MKVVTLGPEDAAGGCANRLLVGLGTRERAGLLALCERVELPLGHVLMGPGLRTAHACFPEDAIVSMGIAAGGESHGLELALVGAEGMVGVPLLLGSTESPLLARVVKAGSGWRITPASLGTRLRESEVLRRVMQQYVLVSLAQLAQAALCTRFHLLEGRLARWLLMTQDRAPHQTLRATHEDLAGALGVRRAGVTHAANALQQQQLITYHRGVLTVLDDAGLRRAACSCYAADCNSYATLMTRAALRAPPATALLGPRAFVRPRALAAAIARIPS